MLHCIDNENCKSQNKEQIKFQEILAVIQFQLSSRLPSKIVKIKIKFYFA
jgi:hypothetical protein